ncbi:hypothetical protein NP493_1947g00007 [Ridgeia piscesae]|uniref:EGF-like domain-containing protein n=1 Tax=Ridgeia piscesae TaxID=27915 RepID=A0AAD9N6F9_RIDPI|nr:hypothetical protein NP493_1947g00007 [Ridgeia piscesae]
MSSKAMEWTLCLLAVSSLTTVNAAALKQEFIYTSEMRIVDRSFHPEYSDSTSSAYKALTEEMKTKISHLYENYLDAKELKRIEDLSFSNGSLVVKYKLVLAKNISATKLAELLARASQVKTSSIGFRINSSSVKVLQIKQINVSRNVVTFSRAKTTTPTTSMLMDDITSGSAPPTDSHPSTNSRETDRPNKTAGARESRPGNVRSKYGCIEWGCHNGGTCIRRGRLSWCKCRKSYSGIHCDIGHPKPYKYNTKGLVLALSVSRRRCPLRHARPYRRPIAW